MWTTHWYFTTSPTEHIYVISNQNKKQNMTCTPEDSIFFFLFSTSSRVATVWFLTKFIGFASLEILHLCRHTVCMNYVPWNSCIEVLTPSTSVKLLSGFFSSTCLWDSYTLLYVVVNCLFSLFYSISLCEYAIIYRVSLYCKKTPENLVA